MGAWDGPHREDGEGPIRQVDLSEFSISTTAVSNGEFAAFVNATGYITFAEKQGGSQVFQGQLEHPESHLVTSTQTPWWRWVDGACWRKPTVSGTCCDELPVVHVSLHDAMAYCRWSGTDLPTEAQWERAAGTQKGIEPHIWRGTFPDAPDGTPGPREVSNGQANEFGLFHACGNVWEWTSDRFTLLHSPRLGKDPTGPLNGSRHVVKGGSFLCSPSYCARFRPSSRRGEVPETTASHLGFRVVKCAES